MGSAESTSSPATPKVDDGYFGVRVTASNDDFSSVPASSPSQVDLEAVYEKGRLDAAAEFQALIPAMGSQLYGEANRRIEQNIREAAEKENQLAAKVMGKLVLKATSGPKYCAKEADELKVCLRSNAEDALVCRDVVKLYEQCAAAAVLASKQDD